jgi:hypothetical protein
MFVDDTTSQAFEPVAEVARLPSDQDITALVYSLSHL